MGRLSGARRSQPAARQATRRIRRLESVPAQPTSANDDAGSGADDLAGDLATLWQHLERRWPENVIEPTLARIAALTDLLGTPQASYPVIHVTGTNGKTSTSRMIESLLRAYGLRTGLFTSPHLVDARERICLDGEPISAERLMATWTETAPLVDVVDANSTHAAFDGTPDASRRNSM